MNGLSRDFLPSSLGRALPFTDQSFSYSVDWSPIAASNSAPSGSCFLANSRKTSVTPVSSLLWSEQSRHTLTGMSSGQSVSSMGDRQQGGVPASKQDLVQRAVSVGVMRICVDLPLQCGVSQNLEKEFSKIGNYFLKSLVCASRMFLRIPIFAPILSAMRAASRDWRSSSSRIRLRSRFSRFLRSNFDSRGSPSPVRPRTNLSYLLEFGMLSYFEKAPPQVPFEPPLFLPPPMYPTALEVVFWPGDGKEPDALCAGVSPGLYPGLRSLEIA